MPPGRQRLGICESGGQQRRPSHQYGTGLSWGSAVLPPFAGAPPGHPVPGVPADILNVTTVASTFSVLDVNADIVQGNTGIDRVDFGGSEIDPQLSGPRSLILNGSRTPGRGFRCSPRGALTCSRRLPPRSPRPCCSSPRRARGSGSSAGLGADDSMPRSAVPSTHASSGPR